MIFVKVTISRYVDDYPQPGIVECKLTDIRGHEWVFVEKVPIVTTSDLDKDSIYPQPGSIACQIVARLLDVNGVEAITIDTDKPDAVQSVSGVTQFDVFPDQLTETSSMNPIGGLNSC